MLEVVSFKNPSHGFLLCVCASLLWGAINSTTTPSSASSPSTEDLSTSSTSAITTTPIRPPDNVGNVTIVNQTISNITLEWDKVNNIPTYTLRYEVNGTDKEDNVNASTAGTSVTHVVSPLKAGRKYEFTIITMSNGLNSTGFNFTAVTTPPKTKNVKAVTQNESSITLEWNKVNDIPTYTLRYEVNGTVKKENVTASSAPVKHVVSPLNAGTKYRFTIITEFEGLSSTGFNFPAATTPRKTKNVKAVTRNESSITLEWDKVNNIPTYTLRYEVNGTVKKENVNASGAEKLVNHVVSHLNAGTKYQFTIITQFEGLNSTGFNYTAVTAIDCSRVDWNVSSTSIQGTVNGLFTSATATNSTATHNSTQGGNVSFTGLYPGASYDITLKYLDHDVSVTALTQCNHRLHLPPLSIGKAHCDYWGSGYSIRVVWDAPYGLWTDVEVNVTGKNVHVVENDKHRTVIGGLQPAQTYEVSVGLRNMERRSERAFVFDCSTDPRGVIAGSVMGVLLFIVLVCAAAFIFLKKPDLIRKDPFIGGSKLSKKKDKAVPITKFPDHFAYMSLDEDRGFGQEYEDLGPVGTEQTQRVATLPDNKDKNRFTNVLPYDWNRVKLNKIPPNVKCDYINASYMPGYNSSREFIATQGPLPSTVDDFWRMIWEQRVKGIVMVTNCNERGKIKCEKYWPDDSQSLPYGELLVIHRSEQQDTNWTLREFRLKHKSTSEERTVKHFHFTVWPDHGVPEGTEVLILFRELVRQHMEREATGAPTVVHCSAGVGRTGTIIALDVLLQQLQKERAVGINALVHKMRLHRPHMVQTESQYVFLHQCIMDYLQPTRRRDESIYENADMIYVNATALKELR